MDADPRPKIGITAWLRRVATAPGYWTRLYSLDPAYAELVLASGGLPVVLPRAGGVGDVLDLLDGLLLTGGDDINPALYGEANEGASLDVDPEADRWELALLRGARERSLPVLAVCRGMQLMSVAFGGRLAQEIRRLGSPEDHPSPATLRPDEIYALRHAIRVEPGTRLGTLVGRAEAVVNSIHHQAVVDPGKLRVSARSQTGIIEAVEPRDEWPALGVQWHPEKLRDPLTDRLFRYLVDASRTYSRRARPERSGPVPAARSRTSR